MKWRSLSKEEAKLQAIEHFVANVVSTFNRCGATGYECDGEFKDAEFFAAVDELLSEHGLEIDVIKARSIKIRRKSQETPQGSSFPSQIDSNLTHFERSLRSF